jgi:uncharacterized protein YyaL (SSP411 family)
MMTEHPTSPGPHRHTNALARESSPYLLQHEHNPVDWHAWGPQAFELARRRGVPIFLSIGYSTCYWCHVMERQCFENQDIAAVMNELFVCIKVDREERPDVDDIYMTATQLMTRRGGWPMSVFLTPGGATDDPGLLPFWCGTYIPPQPMHGMASFPQVLRGVSEAWRQRRDEVIDQARRVADAVAQTVSDRDTTGPLSLQLVSGAANQLLRTYDPEHGGFGGAPKFPQPSNLLFLMAVHCNRPDAEVWPAVAHTLDRMARGGMYDQVGGGFHRYSTDEQWLVPHFEKMLYDNGQLLEAYATAHTIRPLPDDPTYYADVVRHTATYVLREMTDAEGAFWSAQDAEVDTREGGNYVWTADEVREAIGDEALARFASTYYGLDDGPNFRDPHHPEAAPVNVLHVPVPPQTFAVTHHLSLDEVLQRVVEIDARLKRVRDRRPQPTTDDKVIVSWNGTMIAGMAKAGRALDEPRFTAAAERAAAFILDRMRTPGGGLHRTWRGGKARHDAVLEDYALLAHGLIELHRATNNARWRDEARAIVAAAIERFASPSGGYFDTLADQPDLFVRTRSLHDGAMPSGNSVMVHNLIGLYEITGERTYLDRATSDLLAFGGAMQQLGIGMVHMHHALLRAIRVAPSIASSSEPQRDQTDALTSQVDLPRVTLRIAEGYHLQAEHTEFVGEGCEIDVDMPAPIEKRYAYADELLRVYEGEVICQVHVRRITGPAPRLLLRYQACTDRACLSPQTLQLAALSGGET